MHGLPLLAGLSLWATFSKAQKINPMNPLIKKEIRLLLPAWIGAMLLAIVPCWIIYYCFLTAFDVDIFPPPLSIMFGMLFLGVTSFGNEVSFKTFSLQLSQPVPRNRIWWLKISLLGAAFISILVASIISWSLFVFCHQAYARVLVSTFSDLEQWIFAFAFVSGGLWATLLLRQTVGAFWVALFAPVAISMVTNIITLPWPISDRYMVAIISVTCVCYAVAGFLFAYKLFMRAQDTEWLEGVFTLTWRKERSEQAASSISKSPRNWLGALLFKEVQIHQVNIMIAVVVLVLQIASMLVRKIHPHFEDPYISYILDVVWSLWWLMPLLIGCSAIAEERKLAVMESQLCLPVSRRTQTFVKFFVALVLSLFLGGIMPSLIENVGLDRRFIFGTAAAIFFISFYASSVSRTTIQAIGLAILVPAALGLLQIAFVFISFAFNYSPKGNLANGYVFLEIFLAAIMLLLLFVRLSFRNFKWLQQIGKALWHDAIVLCISFLVIVVLTNAIYFRTWESLTPVEAAHGPARLSVSTLPKFFVGEDAIYALLPDGRLWAEQIYVRPVNEWGEAYLSSGEQCWIGDSNWLAVAINSRQCLAIQSNGTLWSNQSYPAPRLKMNRLGSDTNWTQIAGAQYWIADFSFLLMKSDGTLWVSGGGLPQPVVGGTNFSRVVSDVDGLPRAVKEDGSVWYVMHGKKDTTPRLHKGAIGLYSIHDVPFAGGYVRLGTNGDLTFSLYQSPYFKKLSHHPNGIPIGGNAKWKAIAPAANWGFNAYLLAFRDDGTLWQLKPAYSLGPKHNDADFEYWLKQIRVVQLGNHSDWLALLPGSQSGFGTRPIALAADGSLWIWDQPSDHIWLAPSHHPNYMGNIFQASSEGP
jgi:hypothetical protein